MMRITKLEIKLDFIIWIFTIAYSIYSVSKVANDYFTSYYFEDTYNDFGEGWTLFINRKKDVSDIEWKYVLITIYKLIPWCIVHLLIAEILRQYNNKQYLIHWYTLISLIFVYINYGTQYVIYFSLQPFFGYLILQFKSKTILWIYNILTLIAINYYKWITFQTNDLHNYKEFATTITIFWINLRSLNYFLEVINNKDECKFNLNNILTAYAYCLYLPFLFTGPLVLYTDFKKIFTSSDCCLIQRLKDLTINLIRYISWLLIVDFLLHFCYINALAYQPQVMNNIDSWALYGAGYCMGQYFQMKYVVFYGLSTTLGKFEGLSVPRTPICIARVHLYSDMWKYFDRGLYLFLLRYIYIPSIGSKKQLYKKICASFLCFLFVYVWHGIQISIAIWSMLNFIGVVIESLSCSISSSRLYQNQIKSKISSAMHRRFICLLASPLFAMSSISNFYFFAGKEIGDIYVRRFFQGPMYVTINVLIILYFGSKVSTELKFKSKQKKL